MSREMLVRAWKDEEYRLSLSEDEKALLPANPAGSLELTDADLDVVAGGGRIVIRCGVTLIWCLAFTVICGVTAAN